MKKTLSIVLSIILLLTVVPVGMIGVSAAEDDVIEIRTIADLYSINNNMSGNYRLMNDIDMTEDTAIDGDWDFMGNGWEPIGSDGIYSNIPFTGTFDGNGHKIIGMRINRNTTPSGTDTIYLGLFSKNEGIIQNLGIDETSMVAEGDYSSGICAINSGTVLNCYNKAAVSSSTNNSYSGGICGYNCGNISNCYNDADISSYQYSGGICGYTKSGYINECYNIGNISVSNSYNNGFSGGICGCSEDGEFNNCYNNGDISSVVNQREEILYSGGICGSSGSVVNNCFNTGSVASSAKFAITGEKSKGTISATATVYCGGICGTSSKNISSCYNTGEVSSSASSTAENTYKYTDSYTTSKVSYYPFASAKSYSYNGGICGNQTSGIISDCYNTANTSSLVTAIAYYYEQYSTSEHISGYSYNYTTVYRWRRRTDTGSHNYNGGIAGNADNTRINSCYNIGKATYGIQGADSGTISNCYYLSSAGASNTGAKALTSAQLRLEMCMPKFDFENTWVIDPATAYQYPQLINNRQETLPQTLIGDVDGDGEVTIIDVTSIQRHLVDIPVKSYNEAAADADGDGIVTIFDATLIQRLLIQ